MYEAEHKAMMAEVDAKTTAILDKIDKLISAERNAAIEKIPYQHVIDVPGHCRDITPGYTMIPPKINLSSDVTDWLNENATGKWHVEMALFDLIIGFENSDDLLYFKLRWL